MTLYRWDIIAREAKWMGKSQRVRHFDPGAEDKDFMRRAAQPLNLYFKYAKNTFLSWAPVQGLKCRYRTSANPSRHDVGADGGKMAPYPRGQLHKDSLADCAAP